MALKMSNAGETNVGMKRPHNEDNLLMLPEENLFVVADGMGGHSSGEIASQIAVEAIQNFFKATHQDEEITWPYKMDKNRPYDENRFMMSVKLANLRIHEAAQREARYRGMGTTLTAGEKTHSTMGEMLRVLAYAQTPWLLGALVFLPWVGRWLFLISAIWALLAGTVAIRQALDFSTGRAVITVVTGWIVVLAVGIALFFLAVLIRIALSTVGL